LIENEKSIVKLPLDLSPDGYSSWIIFRLTFCSALGSEKEEGLL